MTNYAVDKFETIMSLGQGGYGDVALVHYSGPRELPSVCAVKTAKRAQTVGKTSFMTSLQDEASLLKMLADVPGVINSYGIVKDNGRSGEERLVLEYAENGSLAKLLKDGAFFSEITSLYVFAQIAHIVD